MERAEAERPARQRVTQAVTAAVDELQPAVSWIPVTIGAPSDDEVEQAQAWLAGHQLAAAAARRQLGLPVASGDLLGWISP